MNISKDRKACQVCIFYYKNTLVLSLNRENAIENFFLTLFGPQTSIIEAVRVKLSQALMYLSPFSKVKSIQLSKIK